MRVLLTGHQGYIGAVMAPLLADAGHDVVGLDTGLFEACVFGTDDALARIATVRKDLRDLEARDLRGFDAVLHLAGLSNDPLGDIDAGLTYAINLDGTARLAALAKEAGVRRFVFSSSCSTYGAAGDDLLDETAEFNPVTPYGISKVKAEEALAKLADTDFSPTFLRNATAYGVSPRLRLDLVLNNLVAHAHTTGRVFIMSDGTPWRPIVHIRDIAAAFAAVLEARREAVHGEAFNVGRTSENYRIRELAQIVAETVPGSTIEYAADGGPDKRCYRVTCAKIESTLPGFKPTWDARRGARELLDAYRATGLTKADLDGPRYKRLATIRGLQAEGRVDAALRVRR
jgi:nucleoside-diphosphate-sugar epimerase